MYVILHIIIWIIDELNIEWKETNGSFEMLCPGHKQTGSFFPCSSKPRYHILRKHIPNYWLGAGDLNKVFSEISGVISVDLTTLVLLLSTTVCWIIATVSTLLFQTMVNDHCWLLLLFSVIYFSVTNKWTHPNVCCV